MSAVVCRLNSPGAEAGAMVPRPVDTAITGPRPGSEGETAGPSRATEPFAFAGAHLAGGARRTPIAAEPGRSQCL